MDGWMVGQIDSPPRKLYASMVEWIVGWHFGAVCWTEQDIHLENGSDKNLLVKI